MGIGIKVLDLYLLQFRLKMKGAQQLFQFFSVSGGGGGSKHQISTVYFRQEDDFSTAKNSGCMGNCFSFSRARTSLIVASGGFRTLKETGGCAQCSGTGDVILVRDGLQSSSSSPPSPVIARYCGHVDDVTVTSSNDGVLVEFDSDERHAGRGFAGQYSFIGVQPPNDTGEPYPALEKPG